VALERFWSNTLFTDVQHDASVTNGCTRVLLPVPQRRRITARLRAEVVEHYNRGMSSRRVAATLGLGRTTVLEILKAAGVDMMPLTPSAYPQVISRRFVQWGNVPACNTGRPHQ